MELRLVDVCLVAIGAAEGAEMLLSGPFEHTMPCTRIARFRPAVKFGES